MAWMYRINIACLYVSSNLYNVSVNSTKPYHIYISLIKLANPAACPGSGICVLTI